MIIINPKNNPIIIINKDLLTASAYQARTCSARSKKIKIVKDKVKLKVGSLALIRGIEHLVSHLFLKILTKRLEQILQLKVNLKINIQQQSRIMGL